MEKTTVNNDTYTLTPVGTQRSSRRDKEYALKVLADAYGEERLNEEEHQRRVSFVLNSVTDKEIEEVLADIPALPVKVKATEVKKPKLREHSRRKLSSFFGKLKPKSKTARKAGLTFSGAVLATGLVVGVTAGYSATFHALTPGGEGKIVAVEETPTSCVLGEGCEFSTTIETTTGELFTENIWVSQPYASNGETVATNQTDGNELKNAQVWETRTGWVTQPYFYGSSVTSVAVAIALSLLGIISFATIIFKYNDDDYFGSLLAITVPLVAFFSLNVQFFANIF